MTKIIFNKDNNYLDITAVGIIRDAINILLKKQESVIFGIPGGRSVQGIFVLLKNERDIPWERVNIFMVDERIVSTESEESNFKLAKNGFIDQLIGRDVLYEKNVHPFVIDRNQSDLGISSYEYELKRCGGIYDVVLLSAGEDGHIASLFPNHHSIRDESEFFIITNDSPKSPSRRMSISKNLLLKSKIAIILFIGEMKRDAYSKFMDDGVDWTSLPAKLVLKIKDSYLLTDLN